MTRQGRLQDEGLRSRHRQWAHTARPRIAPWALGLLTGCSLIVNPQLPSEPSDVDGGVTTMACAVRSDCADLGQTFVCGTSGECVNALNTDCSKYVGPIEEDNVILVGSIMPTIGDFMSIGLPIERAQELALLEINDSGGLPGGRRLVMIECNSGGSREQGLEAARHLVDTLGVPVIFGPAFSSIFIDVTTLVSSPAGTMTISPSATSPTISGIADDGLGWRTAASDTFQGVAIADLLRERGFTKVIALGKDDAYGRGLLNRVSEELIGELGEDNFYSLVFPDPGTTPNPDFASAVIGALDAIPDPDVAILLGTTEVAEVLNLFEEALSDTSTVVNLRYIMADGGKADETLQRAMDDETLIARIEGTESDHRNGQLYTAFSLRYQQRFGVAPGIYNANAYDAVYLVAYGMSSIPEGSPLTGRAVAQSMSKLLDGRVIEAGPSNINDARNTLVAGATIDYEGASGPLDFDVTTGEAGANVARWIVEKRANGDFRFINLGRYTIDDTGTGTWAISE